MHDNGTSYQPVITCHVSSKHTHTHLWKCVHRGCFIYLTLALSQVSPWWWINDNPAPLWNSRLVIQRTFSLWQTIKCEVQQRGELVSSQSARRGGATQSFTSKRKKISCFSSEERRSGGRKKVCVMGWLHSRGGKSGEESAAGFEIGRENEATRRDPFSERRSWVRLRQRGPSCELWDRDR